MKHGCNDLPAQKENGILSAKRILDLGSWPDVFAHRSLWVMGANVLDHKLQSGPSAEGVAVDSECDVPRRVGQDEFAAAKINGILLMISLPEHEAQVVVFHAYGRAAQPDISGYEDRLRIAVAEGLQQIVLAHELE